MTIEINPDFKKAHELLKKNSNYKLSVDEFVRQGRIFQGLLYRGVNESGWGVDKITHSFLEEYLFLNNNEIHVDWYFQCFFIWQRLKGEFDKRAARSGAVRTLKVRRLEGVIYEIFQKGMNEYKVKFIRSDEKPKLKIPSNAIKCHDFYWWIK